MNKPPVNSLNLEFLDEINTQLCKLQKDKIRGMILTSVCNMYIFLSNVFFFFCILTKYIFVLIFYNFRVFRKCFVQD